MALQYLDAESNPYFVVLRSSDGTYQGSWSSAYSMKFQGDYAVLIGHNNAEMGLKIKFDEIDWGACLPVPDPIPTDTEGYMAYLSTLFTGQLGTLISPSNKQYFFTTPIIAIPFTDYPELYFPFSAGNGDFSTDINNILTLGFAATVNEVEMKVVANDLAEDFIIQLLDEDDNIYAEATVPATTTGIISLAVSDPSITVSNKGLCYKISSISVTGSIAISSIRARLTPTA